MNNGKKFEAHFKQSCEEQDLEYTRFRDAGWQGEQTQRRFTVSNICDCFVFDGKKLVFLELKSRERSLRFDDLKQIDDLEKKNKPDKNMYAGFLCQLKGRVFYIDTSIVYYMMYNLCKKSFNAEDAEEHGIELTEILPKGCRKKRLNVKDLFFRI